MNEDMENLNLNECVQVVVRCRPMNKQEISNGYKTVVEIFPDRKSIGVYDPKSGDIFKMFTFDNVYDCESTQQELFDTSVCPLIDSVLDGFNATVFAYGQTGTGKTYTLEGNSSSKGMIPKVCEYIFDCISESENTQYLVRASYLEIYQEEIRDLTNVHSKIKCELRENGDAGVYVKNLQTFACKNMEEIINVMEMGKKNRTVGSTNMNEHSSRSHAIFMITVEMSEINETSLTNKLKVGTINLVDLAGSECLSKTEATGEKLKEGCKINLSLSALSKVINTLVSNKDQYVPYRDSKLTRLLQNSLGGNSRTLMIANIGPACYNYSETVTTLRYARQAKNIKNTPRINEDPKDALLREYQQEIDRLKILVAEKFAKSNKKHKAISLKSPLLLSEVTTTAEKETEIILPDKFSNNIIIRTNDDGSKYEEELRLSAMQSKLLKGTFSIFQTEELQNILESRTMVIKEKEHNEKIIQQEIQIKEESTEEMKGNYCNLHQEVRIKKLKLNQLYKQLLDVKQWISDENENFHSKRRELEWKKSELLKKIKLKTLIIGNFISEEEVDKAVSKLAYEEEEEFWGSSETADNIANILKSPYAFRQAKSRFSILGLFVTSNPRFRKENIIDLDTDKYKEYNRPKKCQPPAKRLLQRIMRPEENISLDANLLKFQRTSNSLYANIRATKSATAVSPLSSKDSAYYPKPRGLVKK